MFWRFGFHTVSAVDGILAKDEFTVLELLNEDELLQECKSHNKKLIEYLSRNEVLTELLDLMLGSKSESDGDAELSTKHSFLASEVLSCEVWSICDAIVNNEDLMGRLFTFTGAGPENSEIAASYKSKVISVLLVKKAEECLRFMKSKQNFVEEMLSHVGSSAVLDLLKKLIGCEDTAEGQGILKWLADSNLIPSLIQKLEPGQPTEVHAAVAQMLVDMIIKSTGPGGHPDSLLDELYSEPVVQLLFARMDAEECDSSTFQSCLVIIKEMIVGRFERRPDDCNMDNEYETTQGKSLARDCPLDEIPAVLRLLLPQMDRLFLALTTIDLPVKKTTAGEIKPLGLTRLKVLEIVYCIVRMEVDVLSDAVLQAQFLPVCITLCFSHHWNNFLHNVVRDMVISILEGAHVGLKMSLFVDAKLPEKLLAACTANLEAENGRTRLRHGYMGHVIAMSAAIEAAAACAEDVQALVQACEGWPTYVDGELAEALALNAREIGGRNPGDGMGGGGGAPCGQTEEDDEDDFEHAGGFVFAAHAELVLGTGPPDDLSGDTGKGSDDDDFLFDRGEEGASLMRDFEEDFDIPPIEHSDWAEDMKTMDEIPGDTPMTPVGDETTSAPEGSAKMAVQELQLQAA